MEKITLMPNPFLAKSDLYIIYLYQLYSCQKCTNVNEFDKIKMNMQVYIAMSSSNILLEVIHMKKMWIRIGFSSG